MSKIVAGPDVYICDECISLCVEILLEEDPKWVERWLDRDPEDDKTIVREFTCPEQHHSAVLSIMRFVPVVLHHRHPAVSVHARIEAEDLTLRLVLNIPKQDKSELERTLNDLGLVLLQRLPTTDLLKDQSLQDELARRLALCAAHTAEFLGTDISEARSVANMKDQDSPVASVGLPSREGELPATGKPPCPAPLQQVVGWILCSEVEDVPELRDFLTE